MDNRSPEKTTRRDFLATTAAAGTALAAGLNWIPAVHAAENDEIRVGVIGTGGRGRGAIENVLSAAKNVRIVALAEVFPERIKACQDQIGRFLKKEEKLVKNLGNSFDVKEDKIFIGFDAYEKLLATDVNYVILATPPGFRPIHLEAAVKAGKNIFTEKPVAVDGPGIRKVFGAYEKSKDLKIAIGAGTQRRHQKPYLESLKKIHDGEIGDIVAGRCFWNQNTLWKVDRTPKMSDLEWQMRNWYNMLWLCGDHIVEQHVHNIDVINWAIGAHPVKAVGMGYRTRTDPNFGHIFNFFAIDFEYPKDVHVLSMCRQIDNCANSISEHLAGSKGKADLSAAGKYWNINGKKLYTREEIDAFVDPYVQEHTDLIASIRAGKPYNELKQVAESTLTAIMGRMSAYTGKPVSWDQAYNSKVDAMTKALGLSIDAKPGDFNWEMKLTVPPVPQPGNDDEV